MAQKVPTLLFLANFPYLDNYFLISITIDHFSLFLDFINGIIEYVE